MSAGPVGRTPTVVERDVSRLILLFTNTDIRDEESFARWSSALTDVIDDSVSWGGRFEVDADQRPGESPRWRFLAVLGLSGAEEHFASVVQSLKRVACDGSELAFWAYEAVGDFVRQSDALPGSRGKSVLAPGAYLTSTGKGHVDA